MAEETKPKYVIRNDLEAWLPHPVGRTSWFEGINPPEDATGVYEIAVLRIGADTANLEEYDYYIMYSWWNGKRWGSHCNTPEAADKARNIFGLFQNPIWRGVRSPEFCHVPQTPPPLERVSRKHVGKFIALPPPDQPPHGQVPPINQGAQFGKVENPPPLVLIQKPGTSNR